MPPSVVSRIKSKLTLLRRSSTSAASANSSPCLVADDEIDGVSAGSSGSKKRNLLRRSVSYTLQPRPKSYMENGSSKAAETMGPASSSTTALVGSDPMKLSQPESGIPGGPVSAEAGAEASEITGTTGTTGVTLTTRGPVGESTWETTAGLPSKITVGGDEAASGWAASTEGSAEKANAQAAPGLAWVP
ncbi:hypothetical protein NQ176_g8593 [Zarea fungicola]|uniref:Uncharacterized protein n=1 Tax=Zarea fungicola TaxID=93591 RepID=A0ACC1MTJ1_9HYPO|nr:hypothetical protein NQ176_g8593 [Lecanicillium fungicola]